MRKIGAVIFILIFSTVTAQTDNVLWTSFQLQKDISKKTTINLKPTLRFNHDVSTYQNASIDIIAKQKYKNRWSMQLLNRLWFIPDQSYRHFIWLDIAHGLKLNKLKIDNRLRYHWALDINDRNDPDYFRWSTKFSFTSKSKVTPYIAIEPWLRTNKQNQFQRIRYEPGINWKINNNYTLSVQYRREDTFNVSNKQFTNFLMLNLIYKI